MQNLVRVLVVALVALLLVVGERWWTDTLRVSVERSSDGWVSDRVGDELVVLDSVGQGTGLNLVFRMTGVKASRLSVGDGASFVDVITTLDGPQTTTYPWTRSFNAVWASRFQFARQTLPVGRFILCR